MKLETKQILRLLNGLRLPQLARNFNRNKILILTYHGFSDSEEGSFRPLHLNIKLFYEQLVFLKSHYRIIPLNDLVSYYEKRTKIPEFAVAITIDDGYGSFYRLAYPILKELDIPATVFLTTDFIEKKTMLWYDRIEYAINQSIPGNYSFMIEDDNINFELNNNSRKDLINMISDKLKSIDQSLLYKTVEELEENLGYRLNLDNALDIYQPLTWDEIRNLIREGLISVGSHTCSHCIITRCKIDDAKNELLNSKRIISENIGSDCKLFSYPNGYFGDFNSTSKSLLKDYGYVCGLTTVSGMNNYFSDVFELKRMHISSDIDKASFSMIVTGLFNLFFDLKKLISN